MIPVLLENEDFLAVDKPAGLSAIPGLESAPNLLRMLESQYGQKLWIVHRIDKEVSGVMIFARNPEMHRFLNQKFETRGIDKTYLAWVHGVVESETGIIDKAIREFGSGRMGIDPLTGKPSVTQYRVMMRENRFSLLEVRPQTGRRHQIRVHLYSLGHPIAGDMKYGDKALQSGFPRIMLHAKSLSWDNAEGARITVTSDPEFKIFNKLATEHIIGKDN